MFKHKYISERFNRRTYIKGAFKGKFVGHLDAAKSDGKHERFFDLEILEGDIYTTQDNLKKWPEGKEFDEFVKVSTFPTKFPVDIRVSLEYLDGSIKYFKIKLQELKLIHCRLSKQVHSGNEVFGVIEGYVSGYLVHYDTLVNEITEDVIPHAPVIFEPRLYIPETDEKINSDCVKTSNKNTKDVTVANTTKSGCLSVIGVLAGLAILICSALLFNHWAFLILFFLSGFVLIPRLYNWLSGRFTVGYRKIAAGFLSVLLFLIAGLLLIALYQTNKNSEASSAIVAEKRHESRLEKEKKNLQLKDSFNHYYSSAKKLLQRRKKKDALKNLERAVTFTSGDEKNTLASETKKIYSSLAVAFYNDEEYKEAVQVYTTLIEKDRSNLDYIYKRAMCYIGMDRTQEAVNDLRHAIDLGDKPAMILHDKINPIKKRVAYYVTRCCDGTTSDAKGQGACSHHGGVCDWNEPVYEEYRKY